VESYSQIPGKRIFALEFSNFSLGRPPLGDSNFNVKRALAPLIVLPQTRGAADPGGTSGAHLPPPGLPKIFEIDREF
jgi:hypothetical protein